MTFVDNGNGTATLAGTPTEGTEGAYPITITATNGISPDASQSFTLTVSNGPLAPTHHLGVEHHLHGRHGGDVHREVQRESDARPCPRPAPCPSG